MRVSRFYDVIFNMLEAFCVNRDPRVSFKKN